MEIANLEVKIASDAQKAAAALDSLAASVSKLKGAVKIDTTSIEKLSKLNGQSLHGLSSAINSVADSVKNFKQGGIKKSDFTSIASSLEKFSDIDTNSLYTASSAMSNLANGLRDIGQASFDGSNLDSIARAVSKFGNTMSTQAVQNLPSISYSLQEFINGLNGIGAVSFNFDGVQKLLTSISSLGGAKATQAVQNLPSISRDLQAFVEGLNKIQSLNFDTTGLTNLVSSIAKLGGKAAGNAIPRIEQLAVALKNMMSTLSRAPTVSKNIIDMTNALANLARTGSSSGRAANSLAGSLNTYTRSTAKATKGTKGLASALGKMYATYWLVFRAFGKLGDAIDIASDLTEVQNVVDVTFGDMKDKVEQFAETSIEKFGMSELTLKQVASRFQAICSAMNIDTSSIESANKFLNQQTNGYVGLSSSMADVSLNLTKLTADMASFYNVEQDVVAEDLEAIFTGMTRPLRTYGLDLTQATLQEWALKQGLDADVQSMSQAEKTMLRYQYVLANTGAAQTDFSRTSNTWANQVRILKQNLEQLAAVIGGTLINALKPLVKALNTAMTHIIAFAKTISNALGKIFGWTYEEGSGGVAQDFEDASYGAEAIEDATGKTAKNVAKIQKGIRDFDELKLITLPDEDAASGGSGGGSGLGGGGLGNIGDGGDWLKTEPLDFESDIDNLFDLGKYIGDKLREMLQDIDWEKVYRGARMFGRGLAQFLNGLISPETFAELGRTIAGALNTALYFLNSFGKTFDWKNFGLSLAAGVNEFFRTFKFDLLADTINVWAHGILDTIITFLDNVDWTLVGTKIGEFLADLDFIGVGKKIAEAIWKAISAAFEVFAASFKVAPIETLVASLIIVPKLLKAIANTKFAKGIADLAKKFLLFGKNAKLVLSALAGNEKSLAAFSAQFPKLGKAVSVLSDSFLLLKMGIADGEFFNGLNAAIENIRNNLTGLQKGVITAVAGFAEFQVVSNVFENLTEGSESLLAGIAKIGAAVAAAGAAMYVALGPAGVAIAAITGVVAAVKGINDALNDIHAENVGNAIKNALTTPGGMSLEETETLFKNKMSSIADGFKSISTNSAELETAQKNIQNTYDKITSIQGAMDTGAISVENGVQRINEAFGSMSTEFESAISALEESILASLGENSILTKYLEAMGYDVSQFRATVVGGISNINEEMQKLQEEYDSIKNSTDPEDIARKNAIIDRLAEVSGAFQDTTNAVDDFETEMANRNIDLMSFIDIDTMEYKNEQSSAYFQSLKDNYDAAVDAVSEATDGMTGNIDKLKETLNALGIEEGSTEYEEFMEMMPKVANEANGDLTEALTLLTDKIQEAFLQQLPEIISQAESEWNSLDPFEKMKFDNDPSKYIDSYVSEYKTRVIDPLSKDLEATFSEIPNAEWVSGAFDEVLDKMFEYDMNSREVVISNDLTSIINGAIDDAKNQTRKDTEEAGKYIAEGICVGIDSVTNGGGLGKTSKNLFNKFDSLVRQEFGINSPAENTKPLGEYILLGIIEGFLGKIEDFTMAIQQWYDTSVAPWFTIEKWTELLENVKTAFSTKWGEITTWWSETGVPDWWNEHVAPWFTIEKWVEVLDGIKQGFTTKWNETVNEWVTNISNWWNNNVSPWFTVGKWQGILSNVVSAFSSKFEEIRSTVSGILQNIFDTATSIFSSISSKASTLTGSLGSKLSGLVPKSISVQMPKAVYNIPQYATGGFPEDGWFRASKGEYFGQFDDGTSYVANNSQIEVGIAKGVEDAAYRGFMRALKQSGGTQVTFKVEGDRDKIFKVTQEEASAYYQRTGNPAYEF